MRFPTTDTRALRRAGTGFLALGLLAVAAGVAKTALLVGRGASVWGGVPEWLFLGMLTLAFGGTGLHKLAEAEALDHEAARRPGPDRPLRAAPGLRRRPRAPEPP